MKFHKNNINRESKRKQTEKHFCISQNALSQAPWDPSPRARARSCVFFCGTNTSVQPNGTLVTPIWNLKFDVFVDVRLILEGPFGALVRSQTAGQLEGWPTGWPAAPQRISQRNPRKIWEAFREISGKFPDSFYIFFDLFRSAYRKAAFFLIPKI